MKKVLITGGAGFIGSEVVRHIIQDTNNTVLNVDKLTYAGNLESLALVADNPRYQFSQTDICDRSALDKLFLDFQPDAVMQLAAESHVDRSISGPAAFIETINIEWPIEEDLGILLTDKDRLALALDEAKTL